VQDLAAAVVVVSTRTQEVKTVAFVVVVLAETVKSGELAQGV
jgi:hypothetical protein